MYTHVLERPGLRSTHSVNMCKLLSWDLIRGVRMGPLHQRCGRRMDPRLQDWYPGWTDQSVGSSWTRPKHVGRTTIVYWNVLNLEALAVEFSNLKRFPGPENGSRPRSQA